jgi:hypothetical protein
MATKKKKKKPAGRKKTPRKHVAKHARKRTKKRARKAVKRTIRRAPKRTAKRKKKRAAARPKRRKGKGRKNAAAKRKVGRKVRRKVGRKATRKTARKTARKRPKPAARKKKKPARRKASAKSRSVRKRGKARATARKARPARRRPAARKSRKPARRKKTVRRFPKAPAAAARKPVRGFSLRKLAARLGPSIKPPIEAYSGNKPYIFASYSHKNIKEVFWCIKKLAESRYRIWYDEGIEPGNEWPEEVGRALTGCQLFLVFMSPAAMDSRNVRNEINFASSENKSVMVVMLQPAGLSEGMQLQIGTVQYVNKNEMTDTEFLEKMKKVLDPSLRL